MSLSASCISTPWPGNSWKMEGGEASAERGAPAAVDTLVVQVGRGLRKDAMQKGFV